MRDEVGAFVFAETDKHHFHPMKYKSGVGALLRAITVIKTQTPLSKEQMTGEWFVNGMLKKDANFYMDGVVFGAPVKKKDGVYYETIPQRSNTFEEKIADFFASIQQGANGAVHIAKELTKYAWKRLFGRDTPTDTPAPTPGGN